MTVCLCVQVLYRYGNTYVLQYFCEDREWEQKLKFPTEMMRMVEKNCGYPVVTKCPSSGAHLCNCNGDCFDHFNAVTACLYCTCTCVPITILWLKSDCISSPAEEQFDVVLDTWG